MLTQHDLFTDENPVGSQGLCVLRGRTTLDALLPEIKRLAATAPFRRMQVPNGGMMSVETTSAGTVGWTSDRCGYRYAHNDPLTGAPWPPIPATWRAFAIEMAAAAGYAGFDPDSCLINRYAPGARMGAHRDGDEQDFSQPIVSVSLGLDGVFVWHGAKRTGAAQPIDVRDGDVVVFGGAARLGYHSVRTVKAHPHGPPWRINLTFRRAL